MFDVKVALIEIINRVLDTYNTNERWCRNPSLGLATKAKRLQGYGPRGSSGVKVKRSQGCKPRRSLGVTSHTPGSVRKCEGI